MTCTSCTTSFCQNLRDQQCALLAQITNCQTVMTTDTAALVAAFNDGDIKPNYNIDGQMVEWAGFVAMLQLSIKQMGETILTLEKALQDLARLENTYCPYQYVSRVASGGGWWGGN